MLTPQKVAKVLNQAGASLTPVSMAFAERVLGGDLARYSARIVQYGFDNLGRVLDAGCGFGQWSLALAELGNDVTAVDIDNDRLSFLRRLLRAVDADVKLQRASLCALPYGDKSFDGVFCYGALFCTPWRISLRELIRVLKPGGQIYVNANGIGYYIHRWRRRFEDASGFDVAKTVGLAFTNAWRHAHGLEIDPEGQVLIEPEELKGALESAGCLDVRLGAEGTLTSPSFKGKPLAPFFAAIHEGHIGVYEIMARKG